MHDFKKTDLTESLGKLLANTYVLYVKTQNFHWHVTGPLFHSLHLLFEKQYLELADAVDEIAERIRTLGGEAPASLTRFLALTTLAEEKILPHSLEMVHRLEEDHGTVIAQLQSIMPLAHKTHDEATLDLLIRRTEIHQKTAWMLRSSREPQQ